jgi:excisionase family DNA binding protein
MVDEELLTVDEVARRLKLHAETVRRWIRAGKLRAISLLAAGDQEVKRAA